MKITPRYIIHSNNSITARALAWKPFENESFVKATRVTYACNFYTSLYGGTTIQQRKNLCRDCFSRPSTYLAGEDKRSVTLDANSRVSTTICLCEREQGEMLRKTTTNFGVDREEQRERKRDTADERSEHSDLAYPRDSARSRQASVPDPAAWTSAAPSAHTNRRYYYENGGLESAKLFRNDAIPALVDDVPRSRDYAELSRSRHGPFLPVSLSFSGLFAQHPRHANERDDDDDGDIKYARFFYCK